MNKTKSFTISVIIPTKNRTDMLGQVLSVLHGQLTGRDQVIVVDTSNPEFQRRNKRLVASLSWTSLHYYVLPHTSASEARNYGIRNSTGKILAFLDDDSVPEVGWAQAIRKASQVGTFCFRGQCIDASTNTSIVHAFYRLYKEVVSRDMKRHWLSYGTWQGYQLVDQIQAGNFFIPRTILDHLTPVFDAKLFPFMAEEMDFSLRLRQSGYQILYVPQAKIQHYFLRLGYRRFILYSAFWYGRASVIFNKRNQHTLIALGKFGKTIAHTIRQKKMTFLWGFLHDGYMLFREKYAKNISYNVVFYGIALSYLLFLWIGSVYGTIEYYWFQKRQ